MHGQPNICVTKGAPVVSSSMVVEYIHLVSVRRTYERPCPNHVPTIMCLFDLQIWMLVGTKPSPENCWEIAAPAQREIALS